MEAPRSYVICLRSQSEWAMELEPEAWSDPELVLRHSEVFFYALDILPPVDSSSMWLQTRL